VLVTGAAGGVGHGAVQLGKHLGAEVTGVCGAANVEFVRSLGADAVLDYTRDAPFGGTRSYDAIFDAASSSDYFTVRPRLADDGVYVNTSGSGAAVARTVAASVLSRLASRQRVFALALKIDARMLERVARHAAAGVLRPHIADVIDLDAVADAQRKMESGHGRGKTVVAVA
jgi:NADPH:quinone reductase-like Zn-dependent oxidoreductase